MPVGKVSAIPDSAGEVAKKFLKGPSGPSVDEAKAAMLAAKEPATTFRGGTRVPKFVAGPEQRAIQAEDARVAAERHAAETVPSRGPGGNVPAAATVMDVAKNKIKQVMVELGIPLNARVNLDKLRDAKYITQEDIDAALGKTPEPVKPRAEEFIDPEPAAEEIASVEGTADPETVTPERQPAGDPEPQKRTIDTKKFIGQIFREGKEWIAEVAYKNGAGTERFTAASKDELMLRLLEGKGNATLKVRETVQRYKLGQAADSWDFFFQIMKEAHDLSVDDYNKLPEAARDTIQDTIQAAEFIKFKEAYPEYYATAKNFQSVAQYLNSRKWPMTFHNLELAYTDLRDEDDVLETRAVPQPVVQPAAPKPEDSVLAAQPVPSVSTVAPVPAAAAPVRKRGTQTTGLVPGSSSAAPPAARVELEDGAKPQEPSVQDLRKMSMDDLKRIATQGRKHNVLY